MIAPLPADEEQRLARLRALTVLDSSPEPLFDSFTRMAAQIAGTPIALISLVDDRRQWFKANLGLPGIEQTPRDQAFCAHAILGRDVMEVPNAQLDPRFADNPLVTGEPGIRFYAGMPLTLPGGERMGTLCVIDRAPRQLSEDQRLQLAELAHAVVQALLLRERAHGQALGAPSAVATELAGHVHALSAILDRLPMAVAVWDRNSRNAYANAQVQQRSGRSAASLLGMHLSQVIGETAFNARRENHLAALDGQAQSFEARVPFRDGIRDEQVQLLPLRGERGAVEGYVSLAHELWRADAMDAAQRALADSERKFRTLSDASPLGVFHTDAHGCCTYTNARWQFVFGLSLEQSLGDGWTGTLHPDDRDSVFAEWQRCAAAGCEFAMEFRVRRPDAAVRAVRMLARAVLGGNGAVAGYVGTVECVTVAREREARLRASEAFLDRTGRVAGIGGWEIDLLDNTLTWSDQTCRIHDLEPGHKPTVEEAIGYYAPEARDAVAHAYDLAREVGAPYELDLPMVTARGRRIWVRTLGEVEFADGRAVRAFGTFQDITWRHDAELALRDSNSLLRQLYEQTPAMMHSIDTDGVLLSVSDLWLSKLGYLREDVIGRRSVDFFTEASCAVRSANLPVLWGQGHIDRLAHQMVCSDGRLIDVLVSAIAQRDHTGRPVRALAVIEDVTEVLARTAELKREQSQRVQIERHAHELNALLAERSEMLNVLAHEVRQPLNNASAALQSAAAALASERSRADAAERLQRAQGVMQAVMSGVDNTLAVATLLGSSEPTAHQDSDVDIDTLLAVAVGDMPLADRERVRIERVADTRTASMDMGLLRLALRNLLANALRYSPPGSPVTLRVADSDQPLALVLDVIDQGPGIQTALLPRLFERGTRGHHAGGRASHGLGLYIVRRVLELQGGRAELVATGDSGTTMRLWIAQGGSESPAPRAP